MINDLNSISKCNFFEICLVGWDFVCNFALRFRLEALGIRLQVGANYLLIAELLKKSSFVIP